MVAGAPVPRLAHAAGQRDQPAAESDAVPVDLVAMLQLSQRTDIAADFMQGIAFWRNLPSPEEMPLVLCRAG